MKKNYVMRFAAVLLVLVLLSTCVVSGTLAKYVTSGKAEDEARVAKWGVTVTGASDNTITEEDGTLAETEVSTTEELFAPGTAGELGSITITGTPEVAVKITHDATVTVSGEWKAGEEFYFPLVVKVNGTEVNLAGCDNAADVATAIETAIEAEDSGDTTVEENTNLEDEYNVKVTWSWAFYEDEATDKKDTLLSANAESLKIKVVINTTVEQVD